MLKCSVCGDGYVEELVYRCHFCGKVFDSYCGNVEDKLCNNCKKDMLNYLFGRKDKDKDIRTIKQLEKLDL